MIIYSRLYKYNYDLYATKHYLNEYLLLVTIYYSCRNSEVCD